MSRAETEVQIVIFLVKPIRQYYHPCFKPTATLKAPIAKVRVMGEKKEGLQTEWEEVRYLGQVGS